MDISIKHLKMLKFAVHKHIEDLEWGHPTEVTMEQHLSEINEYKELETMLEQILLKE